MTMLAHVPGLPGPIVTPASIRKLRGELQMNRSDFARLLGTSERTIANWEGAGSQPREMSERAMIPLFRLCEALLEVVAREEIGPWFWRANAAFGGLKPIEVIERGEMDRLWGMIYDLRAGTHG